MNELTEHELRMKEIREDELKDFIGFLDYCITDFNAAEIEYKDFDDPNKELVDVIEKKYISYY